MYARHLFVRFLSLPLALVLVACGGGTPATEAPATATTIAALPTPVAAAATPTTPAAAEPTAPAATGPAATGAPAAAAPAAVCPDVPRPALLLEGEVAGVVQIVDPLTGAECELELAADGTILGDMQGAGGDLYYYTTRWDQSRSVAYHYTGEGAPEELTFSQHQGESFFNYGLAASADGALLAWSGAEPTGGDLFALRSSLWLGDATGEHIVALLEDVTYAREEGGSGRFIRPLRFSDDGATLYFTWQPTGLGGTWNAFSGSYDNLYAIPVAGGEVEELYACGDAQMTLCIGDFSGDGRYLAYGDSRAGAVTVLDLESGETVATIAAPGADYVAYPLFAPQGDLVFLSADIPQSDDPMLTFPEPAYLSRVAAPYTGEAQTFLTVDGVTMLRGMLDTERVIYHLVDGETGSFVVVSDLAGVEVMRRSGNYKGVLR
jgi:hypothetical protein